MVTEVDAALRTAIYFEAVKDYEAERATTITDELIAVVVALLIKRGYTSFANVKASQIRTFLADVKTQLTIVFDKGDATLAARMLTVLSVLLETKKTSAAYFTGKNPALEKSKYEGTEASNKALLAEIQKEDIPGIGASMLLMLKEYRRGATQQINMMIKRAFADNWTVEQLIKTLKGTPAKNFRDGALNKLANNLKSYVHTAMQHMTSAISYGIDSLLFDRYQWISTIDSATTDICRSRHLRIYEYGRGPRPPAHIRCRSVIVGIVGDLSNQIPRSFYDWIRDQPRDFLSDVLTPAEVRAIADGSARARDYPVYRNVRHMTPQQFGQRARNIFNPEGT